MLLLEMMIKRRLKNRKPKIANRKLQKAGMALLVVLFIVMVITVLSLGFLSRSDVELACGENMILRSQMDYLAESGLEHARGLILSPQDVDTEYWMGAERLQLVAGSDDYYDVSVERHEPSSGPTYRCSYDVTSIAYREKGGEEVGRSGLKGEVRLDPCIAYWAGVSTTIRRRVTINGDVWCGGDLSGDGDINGDVYAGGQITIFPSKIKGQENEFVAESPVVWPGLDISDFSSTYYIESASYSTYIVDSNIHPNGNFSPSVSNPSGVRYCNGDVELPGGVNIEGMLVVNGTLRISGANNVISAVKNFPALLVSGEVVMEDGATLEVNGLAQISQRIIVSDGAENVDVDVVGGLFIANGGIEGAISNSVSVNVMAAPAIASIQTWPEAGTAKRWRPAEGAFFKSIKRN